MNIFTKLELVAAKGLLLMHRMVKLLEEIKTLLEQERKS